MPHEIFYSELFGVLTLEREILQRVVDAASQQQDALVHFDADLIERIAHDQEVYARQLEECENQRLRLLQTTFNLADAEVRSLTMTQLELMIDERHRAELQEFRTSMMNLSSDIQFVNNVNRVLALRGRNSVTATLDHVRSQRLHVINASL